MRDETIRLSMIGEILRRRRRLLTVVAALGCAVGALAWYLLPPAFASTSTVLLQGDRAEEEILTEAQVAASRVVVDRAAAELGWDIGILAGDPVSAEVTEGNVIKITANAGTPRRARDLAVQVTEAYVEFSTESAAQAAQATAEALSGRRAELQRQVFELDGTIGERTAEGADTTELDALRANRTELLQQLNEIDELIATEKAEAAVGQVNIRVIEQPSKPLGPTTPNVPQLVATGAVLSVLLSTVILVGVRLADQRLRRRSDIASALGAPVLGTVQAPTDIGPGELRSGRWRSGARWLLDTGPPQVPPADRGLEELRCRRVLDRLRETPDGELRLLVVAADDDPRAYGAVARLAAAATAGGRPVSVLTDDARLGKAVEKGASEQRPQPDGVEVAPATTSTYLAGTLLRVQTVSPTRPTIPHAADVAGALVAVTAGTRTPWELLAVAEACHDAVVPLKGALLVVPPGADEDVEGDLRPTPEQPTPRTEYGNGHAATTTWPLNGAARGGKT